MTQPVDYGRRDFLRYAGILGAGLVLPNALKSLGTPISPLEAKAAEYQAKYQKATKIQDPNASGIAKIILQGIRNTNRSVETNQPISLILYGEIYNTYDHAIESVKKYFEYAKNPDWRIAREYKGLEVVALMWQANFLMGIVNRNIIFTGETIKIEGLPIIKANHKIGDAYTGNNLFRALQNYERVLQILSESKGKGSVDYKGLPNFVGAGILGDFGEVASPQKVYERMSKTIQLLMGNADKKYYTALERKKKQVDKKLENLNKQRASAKSLVW